jgi:hypothetical protein
MIKPVPQSPFVVEPVVQGLNLIPFPFAEAESRPRVVASSVWPYQNNFLLSHQMKTSRIQSTFNASVRDPY